MSKEHIELLKVLEANGLHKLDVRQYRDSNPIVVRHRNLASKFYFGEEFQLDNPPSVEELIAGDRPLPFIALGHHTDMYRGEFLGDIFNFVYRRSGDYSMWNIKYDKMNIIILTDTDEFKKYYKNFVNKHLNKLSDLTRHRRFIKSLERSRIYVCHKNLPYYNPIYYHNPKMFTYKTSIVDKRIKDWNEVPIIIKHTIHDFHGPDYQEFIVPMNDGSFLIEEVDEALVEEFKIKNKIYKAERRMHSMCAANAELITENEQVLEPMFDHIDQTIANQVGDIVLSDEPTQIAVDPAMEQLGLMDIFTEIGTILGTLHKTDLTPVELEKYLVPEREPDFNNPEVHTHHTMLKEQFGEFEVQYRKKLIEHADYNSACNFYPQSIFNVGISEEVEDIAEKFFDAVEDLKDLEVDVNVNHNFPPELIDFLKNNKDVNLNAIKVDMMHSFGVGTGGESLTEWVYNLIKEKFSQLPSYVLVALIIALIFTYKPKTTLQRFTCGMIVMGLVALNEDLKHIAKGLKTFFFSILDGFAPQYLEDTDYTALASSFFTLYLWGTGAKKDDSDTILGIFKNVTKCLPTINNLTTAFSLVMNATYSLCRMVFSKQDDNSYYISTGYKIVDQYLVKVKKLFKTDEANDLIPTDEAMQEVETYIEVGEEIQRNLGTSRKIQTLKTQIGMIIIRLKNIKKSLVATGFKFTGVRVEPISLLMLGIPGVGKTLCMQHVAHAIAMLTFTKEEMELYKQHPSALIFNRQAETVYWDGYNKNKKIVLFDDLGQARDVAGSPDNEVFNCIRAINSFEYLLHMAAIENKGNTYFRSSVVIASSNLEKFDFQSIMDMGAFIRRWDLIVRVTVKPEFADERGMLDGTKLKDGRFMPTCCQFQKLRKKLAVGVSRNEMSEWDNVGKPMEFHEMMAEFYQIYKAKEARHDKYLQELDSTIEQYEAIRAVNDDKEKKDQFTPQGPYPYIPENNPVKNYNDFLWVVGLGDYMSTWVSEINQEEGPFLEYLLEQYNKDAKIKQAFDSKEWTIQRWCHMIKLKYYKQFGLRTPRTYEMPLFFSIICNDILSYPEMYPDDDEDMCHARLDCLDYYPISGQWPGLIENYINGILENVHIATVFLSNLVTDPKTTICSLRLHQFYELAKFWIWREAESGANIWYHLFNSRVQSYTFAGGALVFATAASYQYIWYAIKGCSQLVTELFRRLVNSEEEPIPSQEIIIDIRPEQAPSSSKSGSVRSSSVKTSQKIARIPAHLRNTPDMGVGEQIVTKTNAQNIMDIVVQKNVLNLLIPKVSKENTYQKTGHIIGLRGHSAIVPYHFFSVISSRLEDGDLAPDDVIIMQNPIDEKKTFRMTAKDFSKLPEVGGCNEENDFIVFRFPHHVPPFKDITKHIATLKDHRSFTRMDAIYIKPSILNSASDMSRFNSTIVSSSNPIVISEETGYESYNIHEAYTYEATTIAGDCGALLYAEHPSMPRTILGMHVAGNSVNRKGIATKLIREVLDDHLTKIGEIYHEVDPPGDMNLVTPQFISDQGNAILLGQLPPPGGPSAIPISKLRKSKIHGMVIQTAKKPAHLRPFRNTEGVLIRPLDVAQGGYNSFQPCISHKTMQLIRDSLLDYMLVVSEPPQYKRTLTFEEAVCGIEGAPNFKSLTRSTSSGYPWNITCKCKSKKYFWGSEDAYTLNSPQAKDLEQRCRQQITLAKQGIRSQYFYTDKLKDACVACHKAELGKGRLYSSSPVDHTIGSRMYFGGFAEWVTTNSAATGICIGTNPYSDDWTQMAHDLIEMAQTDQSGCDDGDYAAYDKSEFPQILFAGIHLINDWYGGTQEDSNVRITLAYDIIFSYHLLNGNVYQWLKSLPSGTFLTAILNCLVNAMLYRYTFMKLVPTIDIHRFHEFVVLKVMGDDNITAKHPIVIDAFNLKDIAEIMKEDFHIVMTGTDKDDKEFININKSVYDISFLKRAFRKSDYRALKYDAPLELQTILDTTNWVSKTSTPCEFELTMKTMFAELSLHGKEVFDEWAPKITSAMKSVGFKPPNIQSYSSARRIVDTMVYTEVHLEENDKIIEY